uniref:Intermediate capsid protein VP6 n=1 Tax=Rotavirus I TaxID=1637496 RepID=A0A1S6XXJ4_9REOV|nr:VP6 [Rotavirus I]
MDLVECINSIVQLKKRVTRLAPNAPLSQDGLATVNDYNSIASAINGHTFHLRDQLGQISPFTVNAPLTSITNVLSTDTYEDIKAGIESMLDALAGAIRSEGGRRNRAVVTKVADPEVKKLISTLSAKSQLSDNLYANTMEYDTARAEAPLVSVQNPFFNENIQQSAPQGAPNQHGGGYLALVGRASGSTLTATCIAGRIGQIIWNNEMRVPLSGTMSVNFLPAPGRVMLPRINLGPGGIPPIADCVDVSTDCTGGDITINFLRDGNVIFTREGPGQFSFPVCDEINFNVIPWDANKQNNANAAFVNWNQGGAAAQPTVSLLINITNAAATLDQMVMTSDVTKPNHLMSTIFNADSFVNIPNVTWTFSNLINDQDPQTAPWSKKVASLIAAFAAQD